MKVLCVCSWVLILSIFTTEHPVSLVCLWKESKSVYALPPPLRQGRTRHWCKGVVRRHPRISFLLDQSLASLTISPWLGWLKRWVRETISNISILAGKFMGGRGNEENKETSTSLPNTRQIHQVIREMQNETTKYFLCIRFEKIKDGIVSTNTR